MRDFIFKGFNPESEVNRKARKVLDQILDRAPYGATATAVLEKDGDRFRCSISIHSTHGPFMASVVDLNIEGVLERIERTMNRKLLNWNRRRNEALTNESFIDGLDWRTVLTS